MMNSNGSLFEVAKRWGKDGEIAITLLDRNAVLGPLVHRINIVLPFLNDRSNFYKRKGIRVSVFQHDGELGEVNHR